MMTILKAAHDGKKVVNEKCIIIDGGASQLVISNKRFITDLKMLNATIRGISGNNKIIYIWRKKNPLNPKWESKISLLCIILYNSDAY